MNVNAIKPIGSGQSIRDLSPLPAALSPLLTRIGHFFSLWLVKIVFSVYLIVTRILYPSPETKPWLTKYYPCRPSLQVRFFLPQDVKLDKLSKQTLQLPLYINTHGGGFAVGDAGIDDSFCTSWATRTGMLVASLNYHKTPLHPFPTAVHDIASLARAVLEDTDLPIDRTKVIMGGSSAGGNLSLTASLLPQLQGRIRGAIAYYPIVDWSAFPHVKFANRLYKEKSSESIATAGPFLDWGYVPAGQNRKEKLLSPCYADRKELPRYICMIGAQHDMLCREARDMMYDLAQKEIPETGWDEGFEENGYKWVLIKGVRHGFADELARKKGPAGQRRRKICEEMYADVARWLEDKVLS